MRQQLSIFDAIKPQKKPTPEPKKNHDPALLNFFEDINGKKSQLELDQWRYKHRERIRNLTSKQRFIVLDHLKRRKDMIK